MRRKYYRSLISSTKYSAFRYKQQILPQDFICQDFLCPDLLSEVSMLGSDPLKYLLLKQAFRKSVLCSLKLIILFQSCKKNSIIKIPAYLKKT